MCARGCHVKCNIVSGGMVISVHYDKIIKLSEVIIVHIHVMIHV